VAALALAAVLVAGGCTGPVLAAPATPVGSGAVAPVTSTELRNGLLPSGDAAAGLVPSSGHADEDGPRVVFEGVGCEELTRLLNAQKLPGSRAEAAAALSIGPEGVAAAEQLYAMDSPTVAQQVVQRYRRSVPGCLKITASVAGAGVSTLSVRPISLAEVGDGSFATVVSPTGDDGLADQDILQVVAHSEALVIAVTFMGASRADAETVTRAAVDKVRHEFADRPS
jgi:hypothetical protein